MMEFLFNFEVCSNGPIVIFGSGIGLVPYRHQANTWTNYDPVKKMMHVIVARPQWVNELPCTTYQVEQ